MGFNSLDYIVFLSIVFLIYWQVYQNRKYRNTFLLFASYFFYLAWNGYFLIILIFSTIIDFYCGNFIYQSKKKLNKKIFLFISVLVNLSILGFFKYSNFFINNLNELFFNFDINYKFSNLSILLPIGISFYTFQSMSYSLDIYYKNIKPSKCFKEFALFVSFFAQLVAGPIVRASEFMGQLAKKPFISKKGFGVAIFLILKGLIKKLIIADYRAKSIVDITFNTPEIYSSLEHFISLLAFHFQVYCDFSGYTDIAIGSAKLFGFKLPINFNKPYAATSPNKFWKKWHMTLSRFAFDYIYRPIGGNKVNFFRKNLNIFITFSLIGFWHGANWNYVFFGIYHAIGVIISKIFKKLFNILDKPYNKIRSLKVSNVFLIICTNVFVIFSLPLFRSSSLKQAFYIYKKIFSFEIGKTANFSYSSFSLSILLIAIISHYVTSKLYNKFKLSFAKQNTIVQVIVILLISFLIFKVSELKTRPFIYFQF